MELTIHEARQTIVDLVSAFNTYLTPSERTALAMADQALKTIEDMDRFNAPCFNDPITYNVIDANTKGEMEHDT